MGEYDSWREIPVPDDLPADWIAMKLAEYKRIYPDIDEVYPKVKAYVQTQDTVTVSQLQRKFRFGYTCGARLIELLEAEGIVSAYDSEIGYRAVLQRA